MPSPSRDTVTVIIFAVRSKFAVAVMFDVDDVVVVNEVPETSPDQCDSSYPDTGVAVNVIAAAVGANPDAVLTTVAPWYIYDHSTEPPMVGDDEIVTYLLPVPPPGVLSRNSTYTVSFDVNVYGPAVDVDTAAPIITHVSNTYGEVPYAVNSTCAVFSTVNGPAYNSGVPPSITYST